MRSKPERPLSALLAIAATLVLLVLVTSLMVRGSRNDEDGFGIAGDGPEAAAATVAPVPPS